jgi:hypothetical protein
MSRISKERMEKPLEQLETISKEDYAKVKGVANIVKPIPATWCPEIVRSRVPAVPGSVGRSASRPGRNRI